VDCLSSPLENVEANLMLNTWSFTRFGDGRLLWPEYLQAQAAGYTITLIPEDTLALESDNSPFGAFGVPHANLIYMDYASMSRAGGVHFAGHLHSPYDTLDRAIEQADTFVAMAKAAVLAASSDVNAFRTHPTPIHRAVFVGTQTEIAHLTTAWHIDMSMAFVNAGYDVDYLPYGEALTADSIQDATVVIALPSADYPSLRYQTDTLYDTAWMEADADVLQAYVENGGTLLLTNSAIIPNFVGMIIDFNEDWSDQNILASRFGVTYIEDLLGGIFTSAGDSPLFEKSRSITAIEKSGIAFEIESGEVLATSEGENAMAEVPFGAGRVLVIADLQVFMGSLWGEEPANLTFWNNLTRYPLYPLQ
jgi:hypothetical protein